MTTLANRPTRANMPASADGRDRQADPVVSKTQPMYRWTLRRKFDSYDERPVVPFTAAGKELLTRALAVIEPISTTFKVVATIRLAGDVDETIATLKSLSYRRFFVGHGIYVYAMAAWSIDTARSEIVIDFATEVPGMLEELKALEGTT